MFEVRLTIAANGAVNNVRLVKCFVKNEALRICLMQKLKGWQFPGDPARKGTEATVTFTIGS